MVKDVLFWELIWASDSHSWQVFALNAGESSCKWLLCMTWATKFEILTGTHRLWQRIGTFAYTGPLTALTCRVQYLPVIAYRTFVPCLNCNRWFLVLTFSNEPLCGGMESGDWWWVRREQDIVASESCAPKLVHTTTSHSPWTLPGRLGTTWQKEGSMRSHSTQK